MTDKQIIINGVNITGCAWCDFEPDAEPYCCINDGEDLSCADNPNCYFKQLARKTQECEELKRKLSNQEQLYQNEIEIYDKTCLQLRQENDDLYLERLALNTANSGINSLLEIKEQENDRYRKALDEIKKVLSHCVMTGAIVKILYIINKAKGEE